MSTLDFGHSVGGSGKRAHAYVSSSARRAAVGASAHAAACTTPHRLTVVARLAASLPPFDAAACTASSAPRAATTLEERCAIASAVWLFGGGSERHSDEATPRHVLDVARNSERGSSSVDAAWAMDARAWVAHSHVTPVDSPATSPRVAMSCLRGTPHPDGGVPSGAVLARASHPRASEYPHLASSRVPLSLRRF